MASHDGFAQQGAGQESSLAYSVLENDDGVGGGGAGGGEPEAADLSLDNPVGSRWEGRGGGRGRGRGGGRGGGGLAAGFLRSCAPHFLLVTVYLAFLLAGGGLYLLFENRLLYVENTYEAVEEEEFRVIEGSLEGKIGKKISLLDDKNVTDQWNSLVKVLGEGFFPLKAGPNEMSFSRSVMFCATTITTIGFGDSVPNTIGAKVTIVIVTLLGVPLTLILLADIGKLLARGVVFLLAAFRARAGRKRFGEAGDEELRAPVPAVLVILAAYFLLSACVVALVEGWPYGTALYFTFVTLTTIGYGDIVPVSHHQHVASFVVLIIYVYLGLSVVAMCYFLVRDAVFGFVYKVGEKLGF